MADALVPGVSAGRPAQHRPSARSEERTIAGVDTVISTAGVRLDDAVRSDVEPYFGRSFEDVRIHDSPSAAISARALGASVYAVGPHIVFGRNGYRPESAAGRHLLVHELAHVAQTNDRGVLRCRPDPKAVSRLVDPISANALPNYGFYSVGPEFTARPGLADVQRVLGELAIANSSALAASSAVEFTMVGGDQTYFAFVHPSLGVVARAGGALGGYHMGPGGARENRYVVSAFVDSDSATTYRPPGGTGELRSPVGLLGVISEAPVLSYAEMEAVIRLLDQHLTRLADRTPPGQVVMRKAIETARADAAQLRGALTAGTEQWQLLHNALRLIDWVDHDLELIDTQRAKLVSEKAPVTSLDALRLRYAAVIQSLLQPTAIKRYEEAQLAAAAGSDRRSSRCTQGARQTERGIARRLRRTDCLDGRSPTSSGASVRPAAAG